ncbi:hypothetical protein LJR230_002889 [Trinickia sp. LjRoot230]
MAKGQLRGNREAKKPKQPKKLPSPVADVPWGANVKSAAGEGAKKK